LLYRADFRPGLAAMTPRELYGDGGACRPKHCEREIAFADSIGGAIYGAVQAREHGSPLPKYQDFFDKKATHRVFVYALDNGVEPDYAPCPSSLDSVLQATTDFEIVGEERFCNRDVPVRLIGYYDVSEQDYALMHALLYKLTGYEFFDWEKAAMGYDEHDMRGYEEIERARERIVMGAEDIIDDLLLPQPMEIDFDLVGGEGFDENAVMQFIERFESGAVLTGGE